jgi:hypothetical protein
LCNHYYMCMRIRQIRSRGPTSWGNHRGTGSTAPGHCGSNTSYTFCRNPPAPLQEEQASLPAHRPWPMHPVRDRRPRGGHSKPGGSRRAWSGDSPTPSRQDHEEQSRRS